MRSTGASVPIGSGHVTLTFTSEDEIGDLSEVSDEFLPDWIGEERAVGLLSDLDRGWAQELIVGWEE